MNAISKEAVELKDKLWPQHKGSTAFLDTERKIMAQRLIDSGIIQSAVLDERKRCLEIGQNWVVGGSSYKQMLEQIESGVVLENPGKPDMSKL